MALTKKYRIEFVHPDLKAVDYIQDIREAAKFAGLNLFSRYEIQLQYPMLSADGKVYVEVRIPDSRIDSFSVRQLRGISAYMLKKYPERYRDYTVGTRLLTYDNFQQENPSEQPQGVMMADRLEAIVKFTRLLQRNDKEALEQIKQILDILNKSTDSWKGEQT